MEEKETKIEEKIENKVIEKFALGVGGRITITKPEKNIYNADLLVEKRSDYEGKQKDKLYFKVCGFETLSAPQKIIKDFLELEFKTGKRFYLLITCFDRVKQKLLDYIWLIPSVRFVELAEKMRDDSGRKILRFESTLDFKKDDNYSGFLIYADQLGELALQAIETGKEFDFKKTVFKEERIINKQDLKEFLSEARSNTFAAGNTPSDNPRLLGSVQQEFQKGEFFYRDIYFSGSQKFAGQEVIYLNSIPIWTMSYIGTDIGKLEESFLKSALLRLAEKCRLGQVCGFEKREYKYEDNGQGDVADFFGQEKIFVSEKEIYKLDYRGGLISDKI